MLLWDQESAELFHQGVVQEIVDRRVVSEFDDGGRPVVFLDRLQVAQSAGEGEASAWKPKGLRNSGVSLSDLWGGRPRESALPEHDIIQGAFHRFWGGLGRSDPLGASRRSRAGRGRGLPGLATEEAVVDDGHCLGFIHYNCSQQRSNCHVNTFLFSSSMYLKR